MSANKYGNSTSLKIQPSSKEGHDGCGGDSLKIQSKESYGDSEEENNLTATMECFCFLAALVVDDPEEHALLAKLPRLLRVLDFVNKKMFVTVRTTNNVVLPHFCKSQCLEMY